MTEEEKKIWYQYLRPYPIRFTRQKAIDNFIVDFYCAKCRLGNEIDGNQHLSESGLIHDKERAGILNAYGVTVIRFLNDQINYQVNEVCREIDRKAKGCLSARMDR